MSFIGNIGERYLVGKANAVPQQLENLAKKQVRGHDAAAKDKSPSQNTGKDEEIEKLRAELAKVQLSQETWAKEVKPREEIGERRGKSHSAAGNASGKPPKSKHVPQVHSKPTEGRHERAAVADFHEMPRRGRSSSIKTAFAARPHMADTTRRTQARRSHSTGVEHRERAPEAGQENLSMMEVSSVGKNPATRGDDMHRTTQAVMSERPKPATDLCVVEVTEEEPQRRRTTHPSRASVVEVIEKNRNRTRYVVK
ncbi:MAG: hypothetical protein L6R35_003910 [Caloplaca aegaea]|nr:MAG: hypothetical protein L6R35_003910 [Caloplaca aegaea]